MSQSDQSAPSFPDELTPAAMRRLQLWRALTELSNAQEDGRLSVDQARLLEALADNLQQLSAQLSQLADLGKQYIQALEPLLDGAPGSAPVQPSSGAPAHTPASLPSPTLLRQPPASSTEDVASPSFPADQ